MVTLFDLLVEITNPNVVKLQMDVDVEYFGGGQLPLVKQVSGNVGFANLKEFPKGSAARYDLDWQASRMMLALRQNWPTLEYSRDPRESNKIGSSTVYRRWTIKELETSPESRSLIEGLKYWLQSRLTGLFYFNSFFQLQMGEDNPKSVFLSPTA